MSAMNKKSDLAVTFFFTVAIAVGMTAGSAYAGGGNPKELEDELQCFSVKQDPLRGRPFEVAVGNRFGDGECKVVVPARFFCAESAVLGHYDGANSPVQLTAGDFICYTVECKGSGPDAVEVTDIFGERILKVGNQKILCVPAVEFME